MKILMFIDSFVLGGAQKQFVNLAVGLHKSGVEVSICTYYPLQGAMNSQQKHYFDIYCFEKSYRLDPSPIFKLSKKIKEVKPDVVVAFLSTPCVYAELSKFLGHGVPIIVSERNGPKKKQNKLLHLFQCYLHMLADKVVFNNVTYCEHLCQAHPHIKQRATVIYNGVDSAFTRNRTNPPMKEQVSENTLNTADVVFKFCVVSARPSEEKGLFDLIHAASELHNKHDIQFAIDWIGPCDDQLGSVVAAKALIKSLEIEDIWRWCGTKTDMVSVYQYYNAIVIPSHREGLSNVLCEAMASGLPSVVTDVSDHISIVGDNNAGLIYPAKNIKALAKQMLSLIKGAQRETELQGKNAARVAINKFSMEQFTHQWLDLLNSTASNHKRKT